MKRIIITYWIFTGLFAALMIIASIIDIVSGPEAVDLFKRLGYPIYLLPYLGIVKLLGIILILVPGFPKTREWAYAGFAFELTGALFSHIYVNDPFSQWTGVLFGLILLAGSYISYQKILSLTSQAKLS